MPLRSRRTRSFLVLCLACLAGCYPTSEWHGVVHMMPVGAPPAPDDVAVTQNARDLRRLTNDGMSGPGLALSRDGRALLFEMGRTRGPGPYADFRIDRLDLVSGARETVFLNPQGQPRSPAWLPDGASFLFGWGGRSTRLAQRRVGDGRVDGFAVLGTALAATQIGRLTASPDGARVAFETGGNIAVAEAGSADYRVLGPGYQPTWSPDGRELLYTVMVEGYLGEIMRSDLRGGSGPIRVTRGPGAAGFPSVSPDGTRVVFVGQGPAGRGAHEGALYTVRLDGSGLVRLTQGRYFIEEPRWGPDGWIYFYAWAWDPTGNHHLGDLWRLRLAE
jgi:WD40-like Beta Propeller Repeat